MINLIEAVEKGYERFDEELPTLSLYGWAMSRLDHEPGDWDESKVHLSDYRYSLAPDEGGCERQLVHRFRGDERNPPTLWERMMWDQGFALQVRFSWLISKGLPDFWTIYGVEVDLSEGLPGDHVGSCDLVLIGEGGQSVLGIEVKTQRGRAFQYMDGPRESHVLQATTELYALNRIFPDATVEQRIVYLDREGQNAPRVFPVAPDEERVEEAARFADGVRERAGDDGEPPEPLAPKIEVRENKGPDSTYLKEPWMCAYCSYKGRSCPGALPDHLTGLGIVAKGDHDDDDLELRVDDDITDEVAGAIREAVSAGNVSFK